MRLAAIAAVAVTSGCASIPVAAGSPGPSPAAGREIEACVIYGERLDRRMYEGVSELSFEPWHQALATIVLRHPWGIVLIDPAIGTAVAEDVRRVSPWFTIISGPVQGMVPTVAGLKAAGISPNEVREVLLTHTHWDHGGAVRDLPGAWVRMSRAELQFLLPLRRYLDHGVMPHQYEGALERVRSFELSGPPLLRFDASRDLFHDGSVIALPLPGHTPGSVGYLVRGKGGKQWLLIGDATWTMRGVELPAHKTVRFIDQDTATLADTIGRLHALHKEHPEIAIVPAHDADALATLPTCSPG